ncbi:alcohol dehydrogenase catalytic domain-containing protein [Flavobacteriaceae bacterium F89]|uniref:Alcohol dehydrogenase catalytic domain-containing protein n=1 Tax=Cerina litoralis TaxID=2874477 RepID=A0AAE3EXL2_9FLAO|nr:alcohol dehydrogenase catalytic domain-containing protein [Cerina litoralis]MCG2461636.1 alcohol dehydrogenase catalytic domain-containing protein [Cerina litoralis]
MKAVVKYDKGPGNVDYRDMPDPHCADDKVIIEIAHCGICGTDLHVYHDTFRNFPPVILGHEFSGKIVEIGKNITNVQIGDSYSVLGATAVQCGHCEYCESGEFMFCKNRRGMGHGVHGAFTKYATIRPNQLFAVPGSVPLEHAALVEPMAVAVHVVEEIAQFKLGDVVLLSGPGPIGLLCLKMLVAHGLQVIVAGTSEDSMRLDMAIKYGAETVVKVDQENLQEIVQEITNGKGVSLAIESAGAEVSVRNCMEALMPLGRYVQVGHFGKDLVLPWDLVAFRQLKVYGSVGYTKATWHRTMRILEQNAVDISDIITHRLALKDWRKGFDLMEEKKAIKILLNPS